MARYRVSTRIGLYHGHHREWWIVLDSKEGDTMSLFTSRAEARKAAALLNARGDIGDRYHYTPPPDPL